MRHLIIICRRSYSCVSSSNYGCYCSGKYISIPSRVKAKYGPVNAYMGTICMRDTLYILPVDELSETELKRATYGYVAKTTAVVKAIGEHGDEYAATLAWIAIAAVYRAGLRYEIEALNDATRRVKTISYGIETVLDNLFR